MRDHWGYWMARESPRPRTTLISSRAHSPGGGVGERGSLAGVEARRPGVPSVGLRPGRTRSEGCSWGTETDARTARTASARAGPHRTSVHLGGVRGWLLGGPGRLCGLRDPGPGSLGRLAHGRAAFLTWLYLLPSVPSDSRGSTFGDFKRPPATGRPTFISPHSGHCLRDFTDMLIQGPRTGRPGRRAEGTEG